MSPEPGCSILITRAPRSARCRVHSGAAMACSSPRTVMPDNGALLAGWGVRSRSHSAVMASMILPTEPPPPGPARVAYRRRDAAVSAAVPKSHMLSAMLIVAPGGTISSMRSSTSSERSIPVGGEVAVQVLHGARTDDRGGDRGVAGRERDRHLDERQPGLVGERAEGVGGVELRGV